MKYKICSLITIFKPSISDLDKNISEILKYSDKVFLLVNSKGTKLQYDDPKIKIIYNKRNLGLSKAINNILLNINDFDLAVLFDQDSTFFEKDFRILLDTFINEKEKNNLVSCIGPSLKVRGNEIFIPKWTKNKNKYENENVISVNNVITSGMIVDINIFKNLSGFDERYPVDFCDFTYCWKNVNNGYLVLQSKNIFLQHEVGNDGLKIGKHTIHFHAPYRNYFLVRDTLNIIFKFKHTPFIVRLRFFILLPIRLTIYFLLLKKRKERLKMFFWGFLDFISGKEGFGYTARILDAI